jgi:hypothetical protein
MNDRRTSRTMEETTLTYKNKQKKISKKKGKKERKKK